MRTNHHPEVLASNFCYSCGVGIVDGEVLKHDDNSYTWVCADCTGYPFVNLETGVSTNPWELKNGIAHSLSRHGYDWDGIMRQLAEGVVVKGVPFLIRFKDPEGDQPMPNLCPKCGERGSAHRGISYNGAGKPYRTLRYAHYLGYEKGRRKVRWCHIRMLGKVL